MPWTVQINSKLPKDERRRVLDAIQQNGLQHYARFQSGDTGRDAAHKLAAKIKKATGYEMEIYESYSSSITL